MAKPMGLIETLAFHVWQFVRMWVPDVPNLLQPRMNMSLQSAENLEYHAKCPHRSLPECVINFNIVDTSGQWVWHNKKIIHMNMHTQKYLLDSYQMFRRTSLCIFVSYHVYNHRKLLYFSMIEMVIGPNTLKCERT